MAKTLLISLFFLLISIAGIPQSRWDVGMYNRYTHLTFPDISYVSNAIDTVRPDGTLLNAAIFFEINKQRAMNNILVLTYDSRLERNATYFCKKSLEEKPLEQAEEQTNEESLHSRLQKTGITDSMVSEQIQDALLLNELATETENKTLKRYFVLETGDSIPFHSYLSLAKHLVAELMRSPETREHLLNPNYTHLGIGCCFYFDFDGSHNLPMVKCHQIFARILPASAIVLPTKRGGSKAETKQTTDDSEETDRKKSGKRKPMKEKEYGADLIAVSKRKPQPSEPLPFQLNKGEIKKSTMVKKENNQLPFDPDKEFLSSANKKKKQVSNTPFASDDLKDERNKKIDNEPAFSSEGLSKNAWLKSRKVRNEETFAANQLKQNSSGYKTQTRNETAFSAEELKKSGSKNDSKDAMNKTPFSSDVLKESNTGTGTNTQNENTFAFDNKDKSTSFNVLAGIGAGVILPLHKPISTQNMGSQLSIFVGLQPQSNDQILYSIFPDIEFTKGIPVTIEAGILINQQIRVSAGARYHPEQNMSITYRKLVPSGTVGGMYPLKHFFVALDFNGFYSSNSFNFSGILSAGIRF